MSTDSYSSLLVDAYNKGFDEARTAAISIVRRWAAEHDEPEKELLSRLANELDEDL